MSDRADLRAFFAADAASVAQGGALFLGDTGTLPFDARRALCQLLAAPSIVSS